MNLPAPEDSGVPPDNPDSCILRIRRNHLIEVCARPGESYISGWLWHQTGVRCGDSHACCRPSDLRRGSPHCLRVAQLEGPGHYTVFNHAWIRAAGPTRPACPAA